MGVYCSSSKKVADTAPSYSELAAADSAADDSLKKAQEEAEQLRLQLIELYKKEVFAKYQAQANTLTNHYILAQQFFYTGEYENALLHINRAASIKETADVLALRGSIYLAMGNITEFIENWRTALEIDPEVPIPKSEYIITQLQKYNLIDENLKKSF